MVARYGRGKAYFPRQVLKRPELISSTLSTNLSYALPYWSVSSPVHFRRSSSLKSTLLASPDLPNDTSQQSFLFSVEPLKDTASLQYVYLLEVSFLCIRCELGCTQELQLIIQSLSSAHNPCSYYGGSSENIISWELSHLTFSK